MEGSSIFEKFWNWRLKESPEFATSIGIHIFDENLDDFSLAAFKVREEVTAQMLDQLIKEKEEKCELNTLDYELLKREMEQFLRGIKFKSYLFPLNQLEGPQLDFPRLISWMKTDTAADYKKILSRFEHFPTQISQVIELLRQGIKEDFTMAIESIKPVPEQLNSVVKGPVKESQFFKPFLNFPSSIENSEKSSITESAERLLTEKVFPAYHALATYIVNEYIPNVRKNPGIGHLENGKQYYQECLRFHTTTCLTPEGIHKIGQDEVAHIKKKMEDVMGKVGFGDDLKAFHHFLKTDPKFHFKNAEDMFSIYNAIAAKIKPCLHQVVKNIPSQPYVIEPVPKDIAPGYPGAYYLNPSTDGTRPGTFYLNTYKVEERSNNECVSLSLHEAEPGHHLQCCFAMGQKDVPDFRRFMEDRVYWQAPGRFAMNSSYIEGWGLYCEYLGEELGLYENPYDYFGRLSHEMLRASRLVVDTGIHAFDWSRQKSIDFMTQMTAMSEIDIIAEVDRYITWPGQACAYKVGELKIKQLRKQAEEKLGEKFDVRDFHELILRLGSVPLELLEESVNKYVNKM